jgi:hypothetical protein
MTQEITPIGPDETAYRLELTAAQLKVVHSALHSFLDDFGHDQPEVHRVVHELLDKLPDEHSIRAIDITHELNGR